MSEPVPQPQTQTGPVARFEASFQNHKGAWTIGLALTGIAITVWLYFSFSGSSSSPSGNAATGTLSTSNDTGTTSNVAGAAISSSDYNSILTAVEGLTSSDAQAAQGTNSVLTTLQAAITALPAQITNAVKAGIPSQTVSTSPTNTPSPTNPSGTGPSPALQSYTHYTSVHGDTINRIAAMWGVTPYAVEHTPGNWTAVDNGQKAMGQDRAGQSTFWDLLPLNTTLTKPS